MTNGEKIVQFYVAITDMYKNEEDRDASTFEPICISEDGDMTDDIYAMLSAMRLFYEMITHNYDSDMIDFLAILTKITFAKSQLAEKEK